MLSDSQLGVLYQLSCIGLNQPSAFSRQQNPGSAAATTRFHSRHPDASLRCAAAKSSAQTSPELPRWRNGFADHSTSPTPIRPKPQRRRAQCRDDSFKSLVHREGFEPSYLRGGADLQSAGFNHSPTCAELQNSPAVCRRNRCLHHCHIRHSSQIFTPAYGDRSDGFAKVLTFANVKNRNARENAIARKHHTWKIPLWSAVGKSVKPPPAPARLALAYLRPEPMLELAKGFEPLTL